MLPDGEHLLKAVRDLSNGYSKTFGSDRSPRYDLPIDPHVQLIPIVNLNVRRSVRIGQIIKDPDPQQMRTQRRTTLGVYNLVCDWLLAYLLSQWRYMVVRSAATALGYNWDHEEH